MPRPLIAARFPNAPRTALLALLLCPLLGTGAAFAQSDNSMLLQRIQRLESDLQILQRQVYLGAPKGGGNAQGGQAAGLSAGAVASLEARVSQLESQLQALTGRIEELNHSITLSDGRLDRLGKDMDARMSRLEQGQPAAPAAAQAPAPQAPARPAAAAAAPAPAGSDDDQAPAQQVARVVGPGQALPLGTPQQQYDYARALLVQRDYETAETAFKAFVTTHPDDQLAGAAQFWLGETYYLRGNFQEAAAAYATSYEKFPKGVKAPDSLLKLGMSLVKLGKKSEACTVLKSLQAKYPNAAANVKQTALRERQQAGCG